MNDEKLIELVRLYPVLYDLANPRYMDTEFKNTIWDKIGEEMNTTGSSCKTRWSNMRDNFRKSLRKKYSMSGKKAKSMKMYKYSEQLSFLKMYFDERNTKSNIARKETCREFSADEPIVNLSIMENTEKSEEDDDSLNEINQYSNAPTSSKTPTTQSDSLRCTATPKNIKRLKTNQPKTVTATVMEYLIKQNEIMNHCTQSTPDPVDAFLNGVAPALKKLPPRYWHNAKEEIFATVQKYENKLLMNEEARSQSNPFSAPTYSGEPST